MNTRVIRRGSRIAYGAVGFAGAVLLWEMAVLVLRPPTFILPSPLAVAERGIQFGGAWMPHVVSTGVRTLAGFGLAVVVATGLGIGTTFSKSLDLAASPLVTSIQIAPKVALAPLFVVWFGIGASSQVLITFLVAFFPVLIATQTGLAATEEQYIDLSRVIGLGRWRRLWSILIPGSLSYIFSGMKVASTLAVIGAVIAEFVSSSKGLGYVIVMANNQLDTALAVSAIVILSAFGLALYGVVVALERWAMPWQRASLSPEPEVS